RPHVVLMPILADARAMLLPTPELAGDTFGTFRTRYWMWEDAIQQVIGKETPPKPMVILNLSLRQRAQHDPLEVGPHRVNPLSSATTTGLTIDHPANAIA